MGLEKARQKIHRVRQNLLAGKSCRSFVMSGVIVSCAIGGCQLFCGINLLG